jgi:CheY-like chemotaxis protein
LLIADAKVSVLVVDDSADQLELMRRHFEKAGCEVSAVATAEEAILYCTTHSPELMVIDLVLPGMSGWDLAKHVRTSNPECQIAISSVLRESRYPDADAILPKPFSRATVRTVLTTCVPRWAAA